MIYFDYNSTAPYSPSVRNYLKEDLLRNWQNPSAIYPPARIMDQQIRECRKVIADFLNCSSKNLFFTSGGTEAINTVLSTDTLKLNGLNSVISSPLEHHATLKKLEYLRAFCSVHQDSHFQVGNNEQGEINLNDLEELCTKQPYSLVSLLSSNNETGVITNIKEVSRIAKKHNCLVHVDAVQSLGKTLVDLTDWGVDFASFSGHKIGAMKGVGFLYARKPFAPLMYGGGQERNLRAGTYNFPAIYSLKLALQDVDFQKWEGVGQLRDYFEKSLLSECSYTKQGEIPAFKGKEDNGLSSCLASAGLTDTTPEMKSIVGMSSASGAEMTKKYKINCQRAKRLPNTSSIYCMGMSNQVVLLHLNQKGICASAGSACNVGSPEPSHVVTALRICEDLNPRDYARSCFRISLSPNNTKHEVDILISALKELHS